MSPAEAFWRLPCASPVVVQRADPIASNDRVSTHIHTVMGSNAFNFTMDYADTQVATCSTCKVVEDNSVYWVPSLYYHAENGSFTAVKQTGGALIYYLQRHDTHDPNAEEGLIAFPKDFRMVAGSTNKREFANTLEQRAVTFVCLGIDGGGETHEFPQQNCPAGLRAQIIMPSCWDGKNLDSADHKSHVAYPSGIDNGFCPKTHPRRFITLFYEVNWSVDEFKDMWYGDGQPFVFSTGDPTGYGYHADFLNGWDIPTLQNAISNCNASSGVIEECPIFTLRSDDDMKACKIPPRVHEPIGLSSSSPLLSLPGCNPIQTGPSPATQFINCGATQQIGSPILSFTDVTKMLGWRYMACAKDPAGKERTIGGGLDFDEGDMTVEKCVGICKGKGFRYAGVEFRSQCFCGNEGIPRDRMPTNGTLGDCSLPCAGDPDQFCGGVARVAVYTQCWDGEDCVNYDGVVF